MQNANRLGQAAQSQYLLAQNSQMAGNIPIEALQDVGQMLVHRGTPETAKTILGRGPCEVCSAPNSVLYYTSAKSSDGSIATLQTCWDCWEAIKDDWRMRLPR
jgi:hypothetical protein